MRAGGSRARRWLRAGAWTVAGIIGALYIGFPVAMAIAAIWPAHGDPGATPPGFSDVRLTTADGVELAAWYAPPRNGAAVILVHGAGNSRAAVKRQASMLTRHGYGVLSIDMRGHGRSSGDTNRLGWPGTPDVEAAVEYLREEHGVDAIGALGESMGAETLLGASAACPEIRAIVADGATRRSVEELVALPSERPLVRNFTARVFFGAVSLLTFQTPPKPLLEEMRAARETSYYFIAAGDVQQEVSFNELFANEMSGRSDVWIVPGVPHTGASAKHPAEYERRIVAFFDEHLLGTGTSSQ